MEDFITFKTFGSDDKPIIGSPSIPGAEVEVRWLSIQTY